MNTNPSTLNYYNNNAEEFINNTFNASISETFERFISQLPKNGKVLDVGCGSGRDTLNFLKHGFDVVAFDASAELVALASKNIDHPILVENIETMPWNNEFDGIWAMASLLHLKKENLEEAITNCVKALKIDSNGLFFSSFKIGNNEAYDDKGRFFSYYQAEELKQILEKTGYFDKISYETTGDVLGRANTSWISFIAEKKPGLILENLNNNKKRKMR